MNKEAANPSQLRLLRLIMALVTLASNIYYLHIGLWKNYVFVYGAVGFVLSCIFLWQCRKKAKFGVFTMVILLLLTIMQCCPLSYCVTVSNPLSMLHYTLFHSACIVLGCFIVIRHKFEAAK